jgi:thiol-disulfide isomerase/thioredoxin
MKRNGCRCCVMLVLLAAATAAAEDVIPWVEDFPTACGMAAEQRRLVLLHFYNDNCPPCVGVEQNVFSKLEVAEAVAQNFLAVKVHAGKNPQLAAKYRVRQWPTDVFVTPTGLELSRAVSPQKPDEYIGLLHRVAQQTGVGAARQWSNLMTQTLKPAADAATTTAGTVAATANNVAAQAQRTTQQATTELEAASKRAKDRWSAMTTPFQSTTDQAKAAVEQTKQDLSAAAQQSAQRVVGLTQQAEQQAAERAQQTSETARQWSQQGQDTTRQWSQQANEAVRQYETQGGDAYRQFREQAGSAVQQIGNSAQAVKDEAKSTVQQASREITATSQSLKSQMQEASQSLLERRSAFGSATPSPASTTEGTPAADTKETNSAAPPATVSPPAITANPWITKSPSEPASQAPPLLTTDAGEKPPAISADAAKPQPPFVAATPEVQTAAPASKSSTLIPASQAPPVALDGFCPVTLMEVMASNPGDRAAWKKGDKRFGAIHRGRTFLFASVEQQEKFLANPDGFAPVLSGCDPVVYAERGQLVDGKRSYGLVTPEKQIVLFADEDSLNRFKQSPGQYVSAVQQAIAAAPGGGSVYR